MRVNSSSESPQRSWIQKFVSTFISAHPSVETPLERRKAELTAALSLTFATIILLGILATLILAGWSILVFGGLVFGIISFVAYFLSRSERYAQSPAIFIGGFLVLAYVASFSGEYPALFLVITFGILFLLTNLLELKRMLGFILINMVLVILVAFLFLPQLREIQALNTYAGIITFGLFTLLFAWHRENLEKLRLDEILISQKAIEQSNLELQQAQQQVNNRLQEIKLAAEVGRAVSQVRSLDDMLDEAVERIRAQFNLYYTQVYLINPSHTYLEMEAGTGEVGQKLREAKHRLTLNANSLNGRAALEKRPIVVSKTTDSPTFKPNPLLPETRSEMSVPLIVGEKVIGVLDMQSDQPGTLNEAILPAFEALAGQLAIAIQNARLLQETQKSYAELQKYSARLSRENWAEYLDAIYKPETIGFVFEQGEIHPLPEDEQIEDNAELSEEISIGGAPLGSLKVEIPENTRQAQASQLLSLVANRVAQHIENLRLLESAERYRLEAEQAARRLTREGWQEFISSSTNLSPGYLYKMGEVRAHRPEEFLQASSEGITLPLKVREESIGNLIIQGIEETDAESRLIAQEVANRLSAHLENLRLSIETEKALTATKRQAQREQALSQITSAVRSSTDPETILRTAARELGNILGRQTILRMATVAQEIPATGAITEGNPGGES